jgi:hypothetical protein
MPVVPFIPAIIAGGASIAGGALASSAAKNAAQTQYEAAQQAMAQAQALQGTINQPIAAATTAAQTGVTDATQAAVNAVTGATTQGQAGATQAATSANELLAPYLGVGGQAATTLASLMAPGGDLTRNFTFQDMQAMDPGYQFRLDQANKAFQASAAARGAALGGGTMQALANYQQNLASGEYANAFNRFQTQQQNRFQNLATMTQLGANVSGAAGANLTNAAQFAGNLGVRGADIAGGYGTQGAQWVGNIGLQSAQQQALNTLNLQQMINDALTGGANARAAGMIGSGNAWQTALGGVAGAASQAGQQQQLINILRQIGNKNPTTAGVIYNV